MAEPKTNLHEATTKDIAAYRMMRFDMMRGEVTAEIEKLTTEQKEGEG